MSRLAKLNQVWEEEADDGVMEYPVSTLVEHVLHRRGLLKYSLTLAYQIDVKSPKPLEIYQSP